MDGVTRGAALFAVGCVLGAMVPEVVRTWRAHRRSGDRPMTRLYRGASLGRDGGSRFWWSDERTVRAPDALAAARMLGAPGLLPLRLTVVASGERLVLSGGEYVAEEGTR